jgi:thiol:disulfide interchange protein
VRILGPLVLLLAIGAGAAIVLDIGGLQQKLFVDKDAPAAPLPTFAAPPPPPKPPEVTPAWYLGASGYDGAELERQSARAEMVVYFTRKQCDDCRRFEHDVLAAQSVKQFLDGVVKVRIDPDDGERELHLQQRFEVKSLPAVVVVGQKGPPRVLPKAALTAPHQLIAFAR